MFKITTLLKILPPNEFINNIFKNEIWIYQSWKDHDIS